MFKMIFKPRRLKERLLILKEEFDSRIEEIDDDEKSLQYKGMIREKELTVLSTFYKNYIINVDGSVYILDLKLKRIPVKFNKVTKTFNCSYNKLISFKNCPNYIGEDFVCNEEFGNRIKLVNKTLIDCPKYVGKDFRIINFSNLPETVLRDEVKKICEIKGEFKS